VVYPLEVTFSHYVWMYMWPYMGISHIICSVLCKEASSMNKIFFCSYGCSVSKWQTYIYIYIYSEVCWKFCDCLTVNYAIQSQKRFLVHLHLAVLPSLSNDMHVTLGSDPASHSIYWTLLNNYILVVFSWEMSLIFYSSRVCKCHCKIHRWNPCHLICLQSD
jgi:hypothetical protein